MTLDFNETCIVNQTLTTKDRKEYLSMLAEQKANTEEGEIVDSLNSLIDKLSSVDDETFAQIYKDRMEKRIFTYPPYSI